MSPINCKPDTFTIFVHDDVMRFVALLALCKENPPLTGGLPQQRACNAELWCIFDVIPNMLSEHANDRWSGMPWRSCYVSVSVMHKMSAWSVFTVVTRTASHNEIIGFSTRQPLEHWLVRDSFFCILLHVYSLSCHITEHLHVLQDNSIHMWISVISTNKSWFYKYLVWKKYVSILPWCHPS